MGMMRPTALRKPLNPAHTRVLAAMLNCGKHCSEWKVETSPRRQTSERENENRWDDHCRVSAPISTEGVKRKRRGGALLVCRPATLPATPARVPSHSAWVLSSAAHLSRSSPCVSETTAYRTAKPEPGLLPSQLQHDHRVRLVGGRGWPLDDHAARVLGQ